MSMNDNGRVVEGVQGLFVPADLVAKLSGVSLGNVRSVLAAVATIAKIQEVDTSDLTYPGSLPYALPDQRRSDDTRAAYVYLMQHADRIPVNARPYIRVSVDS